MANKKWCKCNMNIQLINYVKEKIKNCEICNEYKQFLNFEIVPSRSESKKIENVSRETLEQKNLMQCTFKRIDENGNGFIWNTFTDTRAYDPKKFIGTINATNNQPWIIHDLENKIIRKLTVEEDLLLMGYSLNDLWKIRRSILSNKLKLSDYKFKRMIGNSLVIPLVKKIIKKLEF